MGTITLPVEAATKPDDNRTQPTVPALHLGPAELAQIIENLR